MTDAQKYWFIQIWRAVEAGRVEAPEHNRQGAADFWSFYGSGVLPSLLQVRVGPLGGVSTVYYPPGGGAKLVKSTGWTARFKLREALI